VSKRVKKLEDQSGFQNVARISVEDKFPMKIDYLQQMALYNYDWKDKTVNNENLSKSKHKEAKNPNTK